MTSKYKTIGLIALVIIANLLLLSRCVGEFSMDKNKDEFTLSLEPEKMSSDGVEIDSAFLLSLSQKVSEDTVKQGLTIYPNIEFTAEKTDKGWKINPNQPLESGQVYKMVVDIPHKQYQNSFAFQTKSSLKVTEFYPQPLSQWVDKNSVIWFEFNAEQVDLKSHFQINPQTEGRFVAEGNKVSFLPSEPLKENTTYQITLKKGLEGERGRILPQDIQYSFSTEEYQPDFLKDLGIYGALGEAYPPEKAVELNITGRGSYLADTSVGVRVYAYPSLKEFQKDLENYHSYSSIGYGTGVSYTFDSSNKKEVLAETTPLKSTEENEYTYVLPFSKPLEEGGYLVELSVVGGTGESYILQHLIQVTPLSVYTHSIGDEDILVWANSTETQHGVADIGVEINGTKINYDEMTREERSLSGETNSQGIVELPLTNGTMDEGYLLLKNKNKLIYVQHIQGIGQENRYSKQVKGYHSAVYLDRGGYRSSDTLEFWGVVTANAKDTEIPTLKAQISLWGGERPIAQTEIKVSSRKTFSGTLNFENLIQGYYQLEIVDSEGNLYESQGFQVENYIKPSFILEIESDEPYYYYGDTGTFTVTGSFYDGTPARNEIIEFGELGDSNVESLKLDQQGKGTIKTVINPMSVVEDNDFQSWEPTRVQYVAHARGAEGNSLSSYKEIYAIPSKYTLALEGGFKAEKIQIKTRELKPDGLLGDPWSSTNWTNDISGKLADIPVTVKIVRSTTKKTLLSSKENTLTGQVELEYDYEEIVTVLETISDTSKNGNLEISIPPYEDTDDTRYWIEVDVQGDVIGEVGEKRYSWSDYTVEPDYPYSLLSTEQPALSIDEEYTLGLYKGTKPEKIQGDILYVLKNYEGEETRIISESETKTFGAQDLTGTQVFGAYFNGEKTHVLSPRVLEYKIEDSVYEVEITTDKESYKPGEKVKANVSMVNRNNQGEEGELVLAVIDESLYNMFPTNINLSEMLYSYSSTSPVYQTTSTMGEYLGGIEPRMTKESAALSGGMSADSQGDKPRTEFVDTAFFQVISLGKNGEGNVEFTLPDNITSWRLEAVGYSSKVAGGETSTTRRATLPFFLSAYVPETVTEKDDVVVSLHMAGEEEALTEHMDATVTIRGKDVHENIEQSISFENGLYANFGKLPTGTYKVTMRSKNEKYSDELEKSFTVVPVGPTGLTQEELEIKDLGSIEPLRYPMEITFFNPEIVAWVDVLEFLKGSMGRHVEIQGAYYGMQEKLGVNAFVIEEALQPYAKEDGGYANLVHGESSLEASAKLALALDLQEHMPLTNYFEKIAYNTNSSAREKAYALAGLAGQNQPVLLDIKTMLSINDTLDSTSRLYLGAGLAQLGDHEGAKNSLESGVGLLDQLGRLENLSLEGQKRLLNEAAATLMLLSPTGDKEAESIAKSLVDHRGIWEENSTYHLELLTFLNTYPIPKSVRIGTLSYLNEDGKTQSIALGKDVFSKTMTLPKNGIKDANFSASGPVKALVTYQSVLKDKESKEFVTADKIIVSEEKDMSIASRVKVQITLNFSKESESGVYTVSELVPTGFRVLSLPILETEKSANGRESWLPLWTQEDGQLTGKVFYSKEDVGEPFVYTYYIYGALPGKFYVEPTYIYDKNYELMGKSKEEKIEVHS